MESLRTIADFIRWGASCFNQAGLFFGHGTDNAIDESAALVLHALHLPGELSEIWLQTQLTAEERQRVTVLLQRRIEERIPAAYLTGEAWFAGLRFHVDTNVLVPRSPVAELIEQRFAPWIGEGQLERLLDLCCGSGCIGIASAVYLPDAQVDLADISEAALAVAERNLHEYELEGRVRTVRSDLFSGLKGQRYDVIVSNPPYVSSEEMVGLPPEYRHEPRLGLETGEEGLEIVAKILREASSHLQPWGIIIVEVGSSAETLMARFSDVPFTWIDFERGGDGVFIFTAEELARYQSCFT
ncbi:50S ribosomal protein L3 N(5)-glutamine methyltransferase [endosymbiont of Ridgeia piscesae]|jgi:ribosomal protein L3 glutamine methyltransferase|uniref:Ribosomal protein uL3 glutamine methyltransferase n=1 Tax=endosymbiont of Ridgeia piscesae TaxID=54398 RepID=A0A0T5Z7U7_9GAMM|nr:50S ribosomal protein L3 N(5)-glutamine methyltransferase [endosymbiont of Ridgeia piscesae]KRT58988.1 [LSU ribosomal protein L3P]-glutamine N5-methyltransferase [endosymbiont of Ridgeia piscesae]